MTLLPTADYPEFCHSERSTAFVSFVDDNYLEGFFALLRSLILNVPSTRHEYVVLHDELSPATRARISQIYPPTRFVQVDTARYRKFTKGNRANYLFEKAYYILELFRLRGYERVVALDTDMVVLDDISELFQLRDPFAAVPQYFDSEGGRRLNSGLLVVHGSLLDERLTPQIEQIGNSGNYELEKHDQGILTAVFDGNYHRLDHRYNSVKRRHRGSSMPSDVKILHFTGSIKPWVAPERGYEKLQPIWEQFQMDDSTFWYKAARLCHKAKNHPLAVYYARQFQIANGPSQALLDATYSSFSSVGAIEEWLGLVQQTAEPHLLGLNSTGLNRKIAAARRDVFGTQDREALLRGAVSSLLEDRNATAELAHSLWVERRHAEASDLGVAGFRRRPFARSTRVQLRRIERSRELSEDFEARRADRVVHAAFYMSKHGNAGDIVLPETVRKAISHASPASFAPLHVHQRVTPEVLAQLRRQRALVIGGGGLFLRDTGANPNSGWQWNISLEDLQSITIPISVFAVGYNRFRGQKDFSPVFTEHLTALVEKSWFFGLRNRGSIEAIQSYLPTHLRERVVFQPCPTTVASFLYPNLFEAQSARKNYIAINIALDRPELRFGESYAQFIRELGEFIRQMSPDVDVRFFAHAVVDEQAVVDIARIAGLSLRCERLYELSAKEIMAKYREPQVVLGMRGHAGMIPFGCLTPIISLVSHAKLRYFLEDVDMTDVAVEVRENDLRDRLVERTRALLNHHSDEVERIRQRSTRLWELTRRNASRIAESFSL